MVTTRRLVLGAGLGTLAIGRDAFAQGATGPIRIATAGPMTGQYAAFGTQMREGATQAVTDINAAGGVLGRQLALEVADDACDPRQAVSVANQLAGRRVVFVAGHFCSGSSIPARDVYAEEGLLQISPASTNPRFTDDGKWNTFRTCGRDDQQGQVAGRYILQNFAGKKVAILHDNTAYGKGLADETKKALNAGGMQEAMYAAYTPGETRLQRHRLAHEGGQHRRHLPGRVPHRGRADHPPGQGAGDERHPDRRRRAGDQRVLADRRRGGRRHADDLLLRPAQAPTAAEVVARFRARNVDPEGYVLYTYAAIQIFADAAKKANTVDPRQLATALKAQGPWQTVLGPISFDAKGDVTVPDYVFYVWRNGSYAEIS